MTTNPRKETLKKAWQEQDSESRCFHSAVAQDLRALFDHLEREEAPQCDHTLRETTSFSRSAARC